MSVKMRQEVERKIVLAAVKQLLVAGFYISVNDGEETTVRHRKSSRVIEKALFTTDEDWLLVEDEKGEQVGWVRLIYGNDGWDVISDYSVGLEPNLTDAQAISDYYSD